MTEAATTTWAAVCARRLARHGLTEPVAADGVAPMVGAIGGAHAQIMGAAELAVGLRVAGTTRADVRHALWVDRTLVKTHGPRGTVHLLPSVDLGLWLGALGAVPTRPGGGLAPDARMDDAQSDAVVAAIADALAHAADPLTVDELGHEVVARTGPWAADPVMPAFNGAWPRWRQALTLAAHRGALCFGPDRGRRSTYVEPRRWLAPVDPTPADADGAVAEVLRRWLAAYGPATPGDFARWMAAPPAWATAAFAALGDDLEPVVVDGVPAVALAGDIPPPASSPVDADLHLLGYFDAYAVGCHPRDRVFPGRAADRALHRGQAGNVAVVLIGGTVGGIWHQRRRGGRLDITVEPFATLTARHRRRLDQRVARIGEVLDATPTLTVGPVAPGPHL